MEKQFSVENAINASLFDPLNFLISQWFRMVMYIYIVVIWFLFLGKTEFLTFHQRIKMIISLKIPGKILCKKKK